MRAQQNTAGTAMWRSGVSAGSLLSGLADTHRKLDCSDIYIVVAHPDDETLACGGQLPRLAGCSVLVVTDGAPRNLFDARAAGFATAAAYAQARSAELFSAMQTAHVHASVTMLGLADQSAAHYLTWLARKLARSFSQGKVTVLTHAFEGGHPDHDAVAFAVHGACRLLRARRQDIELIEFPLYRAGDSEMVRQSFAPPLNGSETRIILDEHAQTIKQRMLGAYVSQRQTLSGFSLRSELFRHAPDYDFSELPNNGRLFYESFDWRLTGSCWIERARAALRELSMER
jgi:N-acetylglucosamine malate deacetylase 2